MGRNTHYCGIFAPDRKQAAVTFRYVVGLLEAVPVLEQMVKRERAESVQLEGGTIIEVITASKAAPRGRSYGLAIVEEAAFLPAEDAAEPDKELLRALRPALARVPGSLLTVVSSPHARRGELWRTWKAHHGNDESDSILVVQAPTQLLNPSFSSREIERAYADDEVAAKAEYGAQFRADVESFVSRDAVEACVAPDRHEIPPAEGVTYQAFVDPSGGSGDSFALAVGHREERDGQPVVVVDCLRERKPPFSPEAVVEELAGVLRQYGASRVVGDRYAGQWPREAFSRHGVEYEPAAKPKSDLYRDALALLNGGRIELPEHDRLAAQLVGLERRTSRGGRDSIDHAPGGHDDLANVVAGLAVELALVEGPVKYTRATWGRGRQVEKPEPRLGRSQDPNIVGRITTVQRPDGAEIIETEGQVPDHWR